MIENMICIHDIFIAIGTACFCLAVIMKLFIDFKLSNKYGYFKQHYSKHNYFEITLKRILWTLVPIAILLIITGGVIKFHLQEFNLCFYNFPGAQYLAIIINFFNI